ncbi:MAG: RNA-binding protein [Firmicutes bacterium]|nr:RNA-binding protein [Bacillota bacterium]
MYLNNEPFQRVKAQTKKIELRLYDEKRQLLKENDFIEFTNRTTLEKITVQIIRLHRYTNFEELYKYFDKISIGYDESDTAHYQDMEQYYSMEEQEKYGVIGIEIELICERANT